MTALPPDTSVLFALAGPYELRKAAAINELLTTPAPVLPREAGQPILPFEVGVFSQFLARLRPGVSKVKLRRAVGAYASARGYLEALARPGAMRHDIDGVARSSVSPHHKFDAAQRAERLHDALPSAEAKCGRPDNSAGPTIH